MHHSKLEAQIYKQTFVVMYIIVSINKLEYFPDK